MSAPPDRTCLGCAFLRIDDGQFCFCRRYGYGWVRPRWRRRAGWRLIRHDSAALPEKSPRLPICIREGGKQSAMPALFGG